MAKKAYVLIDTEKGRSIDVVLALNGVPGLLAADAILGPHGVIAVIEAENVDKLARIVNDKIALVDGVTHTETCLVYS
jgi:DNA-binding Lrp family transcriptional regulator